MTLPVHRNQRSFQRKSKLLVRIVFLLPVSVCGFSGPLAVATPLQPGIVYLTPGVCQNALSDFLQIFKSAYDAPAEPQTEPYIVIWRNGEISPGRTLNPYFYGRRVRAISLYDAPRSVAQKIQEVDGWARFVTQGDGHSFYTPTLGGNQALNFQDGEGYSYTGYTTGDPPIDGNLVSVDSSGVVTVQTLDGNRVRISSDDYYPMRILLRLF